MASEVWKDVPGFEGYYQASNMGRVKSLVRKGRKSEVILKGSPNNIGYMLVQLRNEEVKDLYGQRSKLAREFGISESTARLITDGITWKHLL